MMTWTDVTETMEVVYTWSDGREEVRYRRPKGSTEALEMERQIGVFQRLRKENGTECPYSFRYVKS